MKKIALLLIIPLVVFSCNNDDGVEATIQPITSVTVDFKFTQNWDGSNITNADYETTQYTNANGEQLTLSKIVYLISDITFTNVTTEETFDAGDYNLIDARNATNIDFTPNIEIPEGNYTVSFTYGFDDEDNQINYEDLNTADGGWSVPEPLGGGYHFMRLNGKYINNLDVETGFQFHNVRANTQNPPVTTDTSINVDLGEINISEGTKIEIAMNVAEWFKNPNQWDLNKLFAVLMPNFDAQIMMNQNGQNVFSLASVIQP